MEINRSEYGINMDRAFASKARCKCVIVLSFRMAYTISSSVEETSIDLSHNYNVLDPMEMLSDVLDVIGSITNGNYVSHQWHNLLCSFNIAFTVSGCLNLWHLTHLCVRRE